MVQVNGVPFADYDNAIRNGYEQRMRITFPDNTVFDEENVYSDGIEYNEVLNSDTDLSFGKAVCSSVRIPLVNNGLSEFDFQRRFTVELGVEVSGVMKYAPLGVFIGERPKRLMQDTIELIGYDLMTLFDNDASEYISSIIYPITIGDLFDSLCAYVGVTGDRTQALNASRRLENAPFSASGITYRDLLAWIAEACGCYARMSRSGVCELVWFNTVSYSINGNNYFDIDIDEFTTPVVDQLRIQVTEEDVGVGYPSTGTFENPYVVYDNPLLYATSGAELSGVAQTMYNRVHAFQSYKPCSVNVDGNWLLQCGDIIQVTALDDEEVVSLPIFSLTINWMGRAEITYQSTGSETREPYTSYQKEVIRQNSKLHEFNVSLDEFKSYILTRTQHTYVQMEDPRTTGENVSKGDLWVIPGLETWDDVKFINKTDNIKRTWEEVSEYNWGALFSCTMVWDGNKWITAMDTSILAEQSSRIEQTDQKIEIEVIRANAAEGVLSSQISMEADKIALEVERATTEEGKLSTKIDITAEEVKSEILSEVTKTYVQDIDPVITQGADKIHVGDFWVVGSNFTSWNNVNSNTWQQIKEHKWEELYAITYSWDGSKWVVVSDTSQPAKLSSRIDQTNQSITMEVERANAAEGRLSSQIEMTAENIRLGVTSAGRVQTVGSYILIESNKVTVDSGGDIEIKSGGSLSIKSGSTFTVASTNFNITDAGAVSMTGEVYSTSGQIGGWYISSNHIGNKNTSASSTVGLHALTDNDTATSTYVIWAGDKTQSSAGFSVKGDGSVTIKKGELKIGGTDQAPNFHVETDGTVTIKKGSLSIGSNFDVDINGNLEAKTGKFTGEITAKSGRIGAGSDGTGGFIITGNKLYTDGKTAMTSDADGVYIGTDGIKLGANFSVSKTGNVTANDITMLGKLGHARYGFTVTYADSKAKIYSSTKANIDDNVDGVYIGTDGISLGRRSTVDNRSLFKVDNEGNLWAKNAHIEGSIEILGEKIAGFTINNDNLNYKKPTIDDISESKGVYIGPTGISLGRTGQGTEESPYAVAFKVTQQGALTAISGQVGGWYIGKTYIGNASNKSTSSVGLNASPDASDPIIFWAGSTTRSNANFQVNNDGTVTIKKGELKIGGTSSAPDFQVTTDGTVTIKKGELTIGGTSSKPNFHVGTDGTVTINKGELAIGSNFAVTGTGSLTAKSGEIAGWTIVANALHKNRETIDNTDNANGIFIGQEGISLGRIGSGDSASVAFKVTKGGVLTAKSGEIAGWTIGSSKLEKASGSGTNYRLTGMDSSGTYAFYAGTNSDVSKCAFRVKRTGQVYLTDLYAQKLNIDSPTYNPDDQSTWTYTDIKVDLGVNGYKIGDGYNTIASYNSTTGKVRMSNGVSFNTAASVIVRGSWSGETLTAKPQYNKGTAETPEWVDAGGTPYTTTLSGVWEQFNPSSSSNPYNKYTVYRDNGAQVIGGLSRTINVGSNNPAATPSLTYESSTHKYTAKVYSSGRTDAILTVDSDTTAYDSGYQVTHSQFSSPSASLNKLSILTSLDTNGKTKVGEISAADVSSSRYVAFTVRVHGHTETCYIYFKA